MTDRLREILQILDDGERGTQVEINEFMTLAEAMAELEEGLVRWFKDEGIEIA